MSASSLARGDSLTPSPTTYTPSGSPSTRSRRNSEDSPPTRQAPNKLRKRASRPVLPPSAYPDSAVANHVLRKMKSDISSRLHVKNVPDTPLPPLGRQLRSIIPTSLFPLPPDDAPAEAVVVPPGRRTGNCLFAACTDANGFEDDVARQRKTSAVGILVQTEVSETREGSIRRQNVSAKQPNQSREVSKKICKNEVKTFVTKIPPGGTPLASGAVKGIVRH